MQNTFHEIDELAKLYNTLLPMNPEYKQKLEKKFRLEFNYNSNHMEGNTLTYGETELLLIFGDTNGNHNLREYEEMKGHDLAIKIIEEWASDKEHPLTQSDIRSLNQIILKEPFWKEAVTIDGKNTRRQMKVGSYKEHPNSVLLPTGEIFEYTSPAETPILMQELVDWYRTEHEVLHPVTLATMLHYKFVRIHPFDDGNGRIARLLINYVLLKNNLPPIIIKSMDKENYLRTLHLADVGNFEPFINYIAGQLIWSLEVSIKAAKGENIEDPDDWEKELQLFKKKIGQKGDAKIKSRYSRQNVQNVYENLIEPLALEWESQLEKFDSLFYNRTCGIIITTDNLMAGNYEFDSDTLVQLLENSWIAILALDKESIIGVRIFCDYAQLRIPANQTKFWAGTVEFSFHDNAYEISFQNAIPTKSIFYNEFLNDEEVKNIVTTFSRNLMKFVNDTTIK